MNIADIRIGERHRKDLGDIEGLAKSIDEIGLLHPVVVRPDGLLICGERRKAACKMLGWQDMPVTVVDLESVARGEHDENMLRKDFTITERIAIGEAIEPFEKKAAKERSGIRTDIKPVENFSTGRALDKTAAAVGMSRPTYNKAKEVIEAAEKDPDLFSDLPEKMDKSGKVAGAYRKMRERQIRAQAVTVPIPAGQYRTIVIDPPWPMRKILREVAPNQDALDYPTMTLAEITELSISELAAENGCHLYLWTTQKYLPAAIEIVGDWGFPYIFTMTWLKPGGFQPFGLPQYNTEFVIFGRTHGLQFLTTKGFSTGFPAPRQGHSVKPNEFYDLVRRVSPAPRINMFARHEREGFVAWGDEA